METGAAWRSAGERERIPGSALVPACASWSEDGRLAVVSDASVLIATFRSRELEMFLQQSPAISKSFVFLPETTEGERVPVPLLQREAVDEVPSGCTSHLVLNETNRHQHNPKELSLSKSDGRALLSATWGPRGSGPNASCAILALSASARVSLHFASSFHMSWKQVAVFSENLADFLEANKYFSPYHHEEELEATTPTGKSKKRRRADDSASPMKEYAHRCAMVGTLTTAWSPFVLEPESRELTSLIALAGRKICTVWAYPLPAFQVDAFAHDRRTLLSPAPIAWTDTERYGWVTTSAWQQMNFNQTAPTKDIELALGTSDGNILLCTVPVRIRSGVDGGGKTALPPTRVLLTPHSQPVFGLCLGFPSMYSDSKSNDLVVASGSTISVWNCKKKRPSLTRKWKAHEGNITGLAIDHFGESVITCGVDGVIGVWTKATGAKTLSNTTPGDGGDGSVRSSIEAYHSQTNNGGKYPIFGVAMSPSSAQVACVYVIPPAARPNRKSQADISYSRVSSSLEYLPSPWMQRPQQEFVDNICRVLEDRGSSSSFTDVVWYCHRENAALQALQESTEGALPTLLSKLTSSAPLDYGDSGEDSSPIVGVESIAAIKKPVYLSLTLALREYDRKANSEHSSSPIFLQAAFLLLSSIEPMPIHATEHTELLTQVRREVVVYWAQRCLNALLRLHGESDSESLAQFLADSEVDRTSALVMADILSVQPLPMTDVTSKLISTVYTELESDETQAKWAEYARASTKQSTSADIEPEEISPIPLTPPVRESCFICQASVPFAEFEPVCESGHAQDRCFVSFRVIESMDTWKCMGCGALANELKFSNGVAPFYLSNEAETTAGSSSSSAGMLCRMCGNYCSFFKY